MSILSFSNLSKFYGADEVFSNISGKVEIGARIGIVGPNGIGKTTLFQILTENMEPTDGAVSREKGIKIGFLQQEAIEAFAAKENSVFNEMLTVFDHLKEKREKLDKLEEKLATSKYDEDFLDHYGKLQQDFEKSGGYEYDLLTRKVLQGLGFSKENWNQPLNHCSGGQKTRALLAKLILEKPDLLIMDEPTNHLDYEAVEWLENKFSQWEKSIIVISHNRHFLNKVVNNIWEFSVNGLDSYKGNYSAYIMQREERRAFREKKFNETMEFFFHELDYIRRFIDKKTTQAKGRMKRLVRHVKAVEIGGPEVLDMKWNAFIIQSGGIPGTKWSVNDLEKHIRDLRCKNPYTKKMNMRIKVTSHLPNKVLTSDSIEIGFPGKSLFFFKSLSVFRNDSIALIGPNGCGKSTLLRVLLGELSTLNGIITLGESVKIGYFAQTQEILNPENTVLDEIMSHDSEMRIPQARTFLGGYLFSGDEVFKKVESLSGGEKGRLTLAILGLREVNFLVLDEPTNHLDIESQEILEDALLNYKGTILLVSHDRFLINRLSTKIWDIEKNRLNVFRGNFNQFLESKEAQIPVEKKIVKKYRNKVEKKIDPKTKIKEIESQIINYETKLSNLSEKLGSISFSSEPDQIKDLKKDFLTTQDKLNLLLEDWEELSLQVS